MAHTNRSKRLCWAQFLPEIGEQRLAEMARIKELEALRGSNGDTDMTTQDLTARSPKEKEPFRAAVHDYVQSVILGGKPTWECGTTLQYWEHMTTDLAYAGVGVFWFGARDLPAKWRDTASNVASGFALVTGRGAACRVPDDVVAAAFLARGL